MTALPYLHPSDEAHWQGVEKVWSTIQVFPPRKARLPAVWWVLAGVAVTVIVLAMGVQ